MLTGFEEQRAELNVELERFGTYFLLHAGSKFPKARSTALACHCTRCYKDTLPDISNEVSPGPGQKLREIVISRGWMWAGPPRKHPAFFVFDSATKYFICVPAISAPIGDMGGVVCHR
jgi:hypothetical protein